MVTAQKTNKKGKPVGKAAIVGFAHLNEGGDAKGILFVEGGYALLDGSHAFVRGRQALIGYSQAFFGGGQALAGSSQAFFSGSMAIGVPFRDAAEDFEVGSVPGRDRDEQVQLLISFFGCHVAAEPFG